MRIMKKFLLFVVIFQIAFVLIVFLVLIISTLINERIKVKLADETVANDVKDVLFVNENENFPLNRIISYDNYLYAVYDVKCEGTEILEKINEFIGPLLYTYKKELTVSSDYIKAEISQLEKSTAHEKSFDKYPSFERYIANNRNIILICTFDYGYYLELTVYRNQHFLIIKKLIYPSDKAKIAVLFQHRI